MLTKNVHRCVAAAAYLSVIGGASILYAQDDDFPIDMGSISLASCSSGTTEVCNDRSTTVTVCNEWAAVGVNGSISVKGGGLDVNMQCKTSVTETLRLVNYWSK